MSRFRLAFLVVLAILTMAIAVHLRVPAGYGTPIALAQRRLMPHMSAIRSLVSGVRIQTSGKSLLLRRKDGRWQVLPAREAADDARVREWLDRLAEARILAPRTRRPAQYGLLGVANPGQPGAGTSVELLGVTGLPRLLIGRYEPRLAGTFVRRRGSKQALLVEGDLTASPRAVDWMPHPLLSLPASAVLQVDLLGQGGQRFLVDRSLEGTPRVRVAPAHLHQPLAVGVLLLGMFDGFDYTGVQPYAGPPAHAIQLRALLSDGSLLTLMAWRDARGRPLGDLDIQGPAGGLPAAAAAGLAETAARVSAHTWRLPSGIWALLKMALYPPSAIRGGLGNAAESALPARHADDSTGGFP